MKKMLATFLSVLPAGAFAAEGIAPGASAWLLTATALVLFMTLPGLALFYAGLVRSKNVLSVLMQCFAIACVVSLLWLVVGYTMAFGAGGNEFIGGFGNVHSPWSADPKELLRYTTTQQVLETFDFSACVRTAMREFQPDVLLCAGPGGSLRAPVGHCVLREGWRGVKDKKALFAAGLVATE